ncbi:hypothetical protein QAD02_014232 [Eretmocerus hayati]|uniref:Uncharacterized protein n=1 Tax=Eretmocerus hayati TaxID=131215 RepID=A0ACC2P4F2_9HYME|nr:hypothetical protein QAD02_014232 [Eretmocerus hayati]
MANSSDTETASGSLNNSQQVPNTTVPLNDQSNAQSTHAQFNSGNSQQLSGDLMKPLHNHTQSTSGGSIDPRNYTQRYFDHPGTVLIPGNVIKEDFNPTVAIEMIEGTTRTAIEYFCLGLDKELMPSMASKEPSSLGAAMGLAITYEKRNNQRRYLHAEQESQSRTGLKCTFCHIIEAGAGSRWEERPPDKISERSNPEAPPVLAVPIAIVTPVRDMGSHQCYHCRGFGRSCSSRC